MKRSVDIRVEGTDETHKVSLIKYDAAGVEVWRETLSCDDAIDVGWRLIHMAGAVSPKETTNG